MQQQSIPTGGADAAFTWHAPMYTPRFQQLVHTLLGRFFQRGVLDDIPDADIPILAQIATQHDIGKLRVPDEIVNKAGSLTPEENAAMREHPILGAAFVERALQGQEETPEYTYFYENSRIVRKVYSPAQSLERNDLLQFTPQKRGLSHTGT